MFRYILLLSHAVVCHACAIDGSNTHVKCIVYINLTYTFFFVSGTLFLHSVQGAITGILYEQ
jgi:hypothetical protein